MVLKMGNCGRWVYWSSPYFLLSFCVKLALLLLKKSLLLKQQDQHSPANCSLKPAVFPVCVSQLVSLNIELCQGSGSWPWYLLTLDSECHVLLWSPKQFWSHCLHLLQHPRSSAFTWTTITASSMVYLLPSWPFHPFPLDLPWLQNTTLRVSVPA